MPTHKIVTIVGSLATAALLSVFIFGPGVTTAHDEVSFETLSATSSPTLKPTATPVPEPTIERGNDPYADYGVPVELDYKTYLDVGLGSTDADCDGVENVRDNCMLVYNPDQKDSDGDHWGDVCDTDNEKSLTRDIRCDSDKDGVADSVDNCPQVPNHDQSDKNHNLVGDACEGKSDTAVETSKQPCKPVSGRKTKSPRKKN